MATDRLDDDEKGVSSIDTPSGTQQMTVINESGLYSLILGSRKPEAKKFKKWVTSEVLPSIRKSGSYGLAPTSPANLSRLQLIELAMQAEQERLQLEQKVEVLTPKAEALDRIATADGSLCITSAAKNLQTPPKKLFQWMQAHQWIYRRPGGSAWIAYQARIQSGLLEHKVTTVSRQDGTEKVVEQVLVTAKGLAVLSGAISSQLVLAAA